MSDVTIPGGKIRSFVERVENIDGELQELNEQKKEVFAEAKGEGFDVKILKEIIKLRKQDQDPALKEILLHNMREEIEHASMVLEWLRRNSSDWEKNLRTYLFTEAPITEIEDVAEKGGWAGSGESGGPSGRGPFTVGPMKGS